MTILLLLIPISLALLGVAVWAFVWAVRRGQFDDLDSAALDILADDRAASGPAAMAGDASLGNVASHPDARPTAVSNPREPGPGHPDARHDAH